MPELRQALARAECHLSGLLLDDYRRQPHVTLDLCGFPAASPGDADEFSVAWLNDRVQRLRAAGLAEFRDRWPEQFHLGSLSRCARC